MIEIGNCIVYAVQELEANVKNRFFVSITKQ